LVLEELAHLVLLVVMVATQAWGRLQAQQAAAAEVKEQAQ
jgi:hypothetical protein